MGLGIFGKFEGILAIIGLFGNYRLTKRYFGRPPKSAFFKICAHFEKETLIFGTKYIFT
jgi:hypothetical protein